MHGLLRRSSSFNTGRIEHLYLDEWVRDMKKDRLINLHWADMTDSSSLIRIIGEVKPTEIYNLAAQSHVKVSFDVPEYTADTDAVGVLRLLEAVAWKRFVRFIKHQLQNCLVRFRKCHRRKQHLSIHVLHTLLQNSMDTG